MCVAEVGLEEGERHIEKMGEWRKGVGTGKDTVGKAAGDDDRDEEYGAPTAGGGGGSGGDDGGRWPFRRPPRAAVEVRAAAVEAPRAAGTARNFAPAPTPMTAAAVETGRRGDRGGGAVNHNTLGRGMVILQLNSIQIAN